MQRSRRALRRRRRSPFPTRHRLLHPRRLLHRKTIKEETKKKGIVADAGEAPTNLLISCIDFIEQKRRLSKGYEEDKKGGGGASRKVFF